MPWKNHTHTHNSGLTEGLKGSRGLSSVYQWRYICLELWPLTLGSSPDILPIGPRSKALKANTRMTTTHIFCHKVRRPSFRSCNAFNYWLTAYEGSLLTEADSTPYKSWHVQFEYTLKYSQTFVRGRFHNQIKSIHNRPLTAQMGQITY